MPGFIEGMMPIQLLAELLLIIVIFLLGAMILDKKLGIRIPMLLQAVFVFIAGWWYYKYRIAPPLPFSVRAIYQVMIAIGIFMWVSSSEKGWLEFKRPIIAALDAKTPITWWVRAVLLVVLPLSAAGMAYKNLVPSLGEPIELRTVHPAPPAAVKVHGKKFPLQTSQSPFRIDENGKYSDHVQDAHVKDNPFDPDGIEYMQSIKEGGEIFFQNCHFCHGDNLNGRGLYAFAFNPIPANFTDPGTLAQLQETFVFWRVAKGGPGLPREGFPWASAMPPWEQHLTTDEIWKVIMFEYWHTKYPPRTWGEE